MPPCSLFGDVLREVGITELTPLPVAERTELQVRFWPGGGGDESQEQDR